MSEPAASHGAHSRQVGSNCADPRVLGSHDKLVDLVLHVHKVLLVRARRTTGLGGLFASKEASEQESSVDDVTSRLVMQSAKKPAASSGHFGPCTGSFEREVPCLGVSRD